MNFRQCLSLAALCSLFGIPANAQSSDPPAPPAGAPFRGLIRRPPMLLTGNNLMRFVHRPDVQSHLQLTVKQKDALNDIQKDPNRAGFRIELNGAKSPEEQQKNIEEQIAVQRNASDAKIKDVLTPDQWTRLQQLDLQWRGPLALGDKQIADALEIAPEKRPEIEKAVAEYQTGKQKLIMEQSQQDERDDGNGRHMVRMRINTDVFDKPASPARRQLDALRKEADKKILALLSDEEKSRFTKAQGEPFVFRLDLPGSWL